MPTTMPLSLIIWTKGVPSSAFWYMVSWKKMTPPMHFFTRLSALKRIWRYSRRFSSVFSTPIWLRRFAMLPASTQHPQSAWGKGVTGQIPPSPWAPALTYGLIGSQDALARGHDTQRDVRQLLLLLGRQRGVLVRHGGGAGCERTGAESRADGAAPAPQPTTRPQPAGPGDPHGTGTPTGGRVA